MSEDKHKESRLKEYKRINEKTEICQTKRIDLKNPNNITSCTMILFFNSLMVFSIVEICFNLGLIHNHMIGGECKKSLNLNGWDFFLLK